MDVGEEGDYIPESLHCHHQNDSWIKMGSDVSLFFFSFFLSYVSLIVRDKVTRQCSQPTIFEEKGEPKRIRTEVLLLTSLKASPSNLLPVLLNVLGCRLTY